MITVRDSISEFLNYSATKRLMVLAENPVDLTSQEVLTAERLSSYYAEGCGFRLLYGTERVNEDVMIDLHALAEESGAYEKMRKMQSGEVINQIDGFESEKRQVLHTAARDFFDPPRQEAAAKAAAQQAMAETDKLQAFIKKIDHEKRFTDLVMVAIGGSDLGPKALYNALWYCHQPGKRVHFISNIDPDNAIQVLQGLDLSRTLVVVVSKSGTTLETLTNETIVRDQFTKIGLNSNEHFVAVTGQGSPMDNPERYLESFYIWDWIGGRYSGTSMVGGVMLSFAFGFDTYWEILRGANAMDKLALETDLKKNLPLLSALLSIWNHNFLMTNTTAIIPYSYALSRYIDHLQQLDMESNGKQIDRKGQPVDFQTGPVIWGAAGTDAQHTFFQHLHQGTMTIPIEFIGFKETQWQHDTEVKGTSSQQKLLANLFAQAIALAKGQKSENLNQNFPGNRPSHILMGKRLTPETMGALLAYHEHKVAFQGFIWNINSFDQEGVQLGKRLANQLLDRYQNKGDFPLGDAMIQHAEGI